MNSKGKKERWGVPNMHYHAGMPAGENTLNAYCSRALLRTWTQHGGYETSQFMENYLKLMTTDAHPDTYAESYHREFFKNYKAGRDPLACAGVTHDTPSIGGLVTLGPLAILELIRGTPIADVKAKCRRHLALTHPDPLLSNVSDSYVELLSYALNNQKGDPSKPALAKAAQVVDKNLDEKAFATLAGKPDREVVGRYFSPACYIDGSWPSLLFFAYKYNEAGTFEALKANAMVGGDNVHRGAVLGTIMGALYPYDETIAAHFANLVHFKEIDEEI